MPRQSCSNLRSVDNSRLIACGEVRGCIVAKQQRGLIMAKRKRRGKLPKRAKLRRGNSAKRSKTRKTAKSARATKRTAKSKRAPVKKAAHKVQRAKQPAVETVVVDVIEQPAPGVITVTELEETPGSGLRRALKRMNPNR